MCYYNVESVKSRASCLTLVSKAIQVYEIYWRPKMERTNWIKFNHRPIGYKGTGFPYRPGGEKQISILSVENEIWMDWNNRIKYTRVFSCCISTISSHVWFHFTVPRMHVPTLSSKPRPLEGTAPMFSSRNVLLKIFSSVNREPGEPDQTFHCLSARKSVDRRVSWSQKTWINSF